MLINSNKQVMWRLHVDISTCFIVIKTMWLLYLHSRVTCKSHAIKKKTLLKKVKRKNTLPLKNDFLGGCIYLIYINKHKMVKILFIFKIVVLYLNIFLNQIFYCGEGEFSAAITPVFSVTWSFRTYLLCCVCAQVTLRLKWAVLLN